MVYFALIIPAIHVQMLVLLLMTKNIRLVFKLLLFILGFLLLVNNAFFTLAYEIKYLVIHQTFEMHFWEQAISMSPLFWLFIVSLALTSGPLIYSIFTRMTPRNFTLLSIFHLLMGTAFAYSFLSHYYRSTLVANTDISELSVATMIYGVFVILMICSVTYLILQLTAIIYKKTITGNKTLLSNKEID